MIVYYARHTSSSRCPALYGNQECSRKTKKFVVVDSVETEFSTSVFDPSFSPDGKRFICKIGKYATDEWETMEIRVKGKYHYEETSRVSLFYQ